MEPVTQFGEITISYKMISDWKKLPIITASYEAVKYIYEFFPYDTIALQEHFIVTYLNRCNRVLGVYHSSIGGINSTVVDPRLILGTALKLAASGIILAHNHPSGSMKPSPQDKEITYKLRDGSRLLDIKVLDHLIVGPNKDEFYSFADEGIL